MVQKSLERWGGLLSNMLRMALLDCFMHCSERVSVGLGLLRSGFKSRLSYLLIAQPNIRHRVTVVEKKDRTSEINHPEFLSEVM